MRLRFDFGLESMNVQERMRLVLHMFFATLCIPIYMSAFASLFGLAVFPYLAYLIFRPRREYLLPLVAHTIYGSQQRYLMLFACMLYCLAHAMYLPRYRLSFLFWLYVSISPFFIWYTFMRYRLFGGGIGHGGTFNGLGYYMAFFPFFWAVLSSMRLTTETFMGLIYMGGIVLISRVSGVVFSRFMVWPLIFLPVSFFWLSLRRKFKGNSILLAMSFGGTLFFGLAFLGVFGLSATFTNIGCILVGFLYILLAKVSRGRICCFLSPIILFVLTAVATKFIVDNYYEYKNLYASASTGYNELKIRDLNSLKEKVIRKAFMDRAPLWRAAWDGFLQECERDPVWVDPFTIYGEVEEGGGQQIQLMAHNIMLLLLQEYGVYGGAGLYLIYILLYSRREIRKSMAIDFGSPYTPIAAACLGHGVSGGFSGQYIMNVEFTFLLYSMIGVVFVHYYDLLQMRKRGVARCV